MNVEELEKRIRSSEVSSRGFQAIFLIVLGLAGYTAMFTQVMLNYRVDMLLTLLVFPVLIYAISIAFKTEELEARNQLLVKRMEAIEEQI